MRGISLLLALLMLCGCTTMRPVDAGTWSNLTGQVEAGDTVEVTTRDGRQRFVVTEVTADALVGANTRIAQADIVALEVRTASKGRISAGAIAAGVLALLVVIGSAVGDFGP